jgi:putative phosphoribosyl transferase
VAHVLARAGLTTLLFDLLTRHLRFNIGLLAGRLVGATDWVRSRPDLEHMPVGYFAASTGAASVLVAAPRSRVANHLRTNENRAKQRSQT